MSSLFSFSSGQKDHLILVVVAATTTIFTFRNNASEQYQRNTDIIPKLFDIVPKANIHSVLGAYFNFQPQKTTKIRRKFAPFTEYSLFKCSFCALDRQSYVGWVAETTPKSMGQNGPLISIGTIPKKVVGIVPNIVPHIVPIKFERQAPQWNF